MKLIAGLGNPGVKYQFTRHNAGFMLLDYMKYKLDFSFKFESKFNGELAKTTLDSESVMLLKPHTYMNLSGNSIIAVMNFFKIKPEDLLIVYDDISLPLGTLRFRAKGSDGGHNGIKSIIKVLGGNTVFDRLKIGIGPQPPVPSETFVLQNFTDEQLKELKPALEKAYDAVFFCLENGIVSTQSRFNG